MSLLQEPPQEKRAPNVIARCSHQTPSTGPEYGRVAFPSARDEAVHSPGWYCNNRNTQCWEGGIWVSLADWIPIDFHHQMLYRAFFPSLLLWVEDPWVGIPTLLGGRSFLNLNFIVYTITDFSISFPGPLFPPQPSSYSSFSLAIPTLLSLSKGYAYLLFA